MRLTTVHFTLHLRLGEGVGQVAVAGLDGLGLVVDRDDAAALELVPGNQLVAPRAHVYVHVAALEVLGFPGC